MKQSTDRKRGQIKKLRTLRHEDGTQLTEQEIAEFLDVPAEAVGWYEGNSGENSSKTFSHMIPVNEPFFWFTDNPKTHNITITVTDEKGGQMLGSVRLKAASFLE